jgi:N4-gp56 family major capsid protein
MTATALYAQQPYNKDAWGHKAYDEFKDQFFFTGMLGEGENAIIEHITELSKNSKGEAGAWLHLLADIHGGGVVGDNTMENRERELEASWIRCNFDRLRNAMVTKGKKDEQKSVIDARKAFRKKLARWLAESYEEQIILTASGIGYGFNTDGSARTTPAGQDPWTDLDYAADVSAPTSNRHLRFVGSSDTLDDGDTTAVAAGDTLTYEVIPLLEAAARGRNITPVRVGGQEYFVWMLHTDAMAQLWKDTNFRTIVTQAGVRGDSNPIFKGGYVTMNNIIIKPYRRTYSTKGTSTKWGSGSTVEGSRSLLMGAQGLAMVDLGPVNWEEQLKDYNSRWGLCGDKMGGFRKATFLDSLTDTNEDFSILAVDHAL